MGSKAGSARESAARDASVLSLFALGVGAR
jgi:hypothetical protein